MTPRAALLGLAALSLLTGCRAERPADDEALVEAIVVLNVLEARHEVFGDVSENLRDSVLAAHGFTTESLQKRLQQLTRRPAEADSVFARVERRLAERSNQSPAADQSRAADSLSRNRPPSLVRR